MTEVLSIKMIDRIGMISQLELHLSLDDLAKLHFEFQGEPFDLFGRDYYEVFKSLWQMLEARGFQLLCNGARLDVSISGMLRESGKGRYVYVDASGGTSSEALDIFGYAPPDLVGTQLQQRERKTRR